MTDMRKLLILVITFTTTLFLFTYQYGCQRKREHFAGPSTPFPQPPFDGPIPYLQPDRIDLLINHLKETPNAIWARELPIPKKGSRLTISHLRAQGVASTLCDALSLEYCRLKKNCFVAIVMPRGYDKIDVVRSMLADYGPLIDEKDVYLAGRGPENYVRHAYDYLCDVPQKWVMNPKSVKDHIEKRFTNSHPVHVFLFEGTGDTDTIKWKWSVRRALGLGTVTLHATDSHTESLHLAKLFFNENTIHFLNHALPIKNREFIHFVNHLQNQLGEQEAAFALSGPAPYAAYGIDRGETTFPLVDHDPFVFDPRQYFYFRGLKCRTVWRDH